MLNFDLHNHSDASDGLLPPQSLVALAQRNACDALALTDHDTTAGVAAAAEAAREAGLRFVPGVEISVTWPNEGVWPDRGPVTLHIVGLNVDVSHPVLRDGLLSVRNGRRARAARMADALAEAGIPDTLEAAYALTGNEDMIGRTHFARVLVQRGAAKNVGQVFAKFLTSGRPGYVPHRWADLAGAVAWIRAAGGVPVIAHPGRYKLDDGERRQLFGEFRDLGGLAIEVVTGSHEPRQYGEFAAHARTFGLAASRGADYHGPGESRFEPGTLPPLPAGLTPVWDLF
ncbi:MAG: PHP domain-containing protein [Betaproteobacteria bacterium]|nr:PHP domain-containing protein [Betaproteobacteria bacterium]